MSFISKLINSINTFVEKNEKKIAATAAVAVTAVVVSAAFASMQESNQAPYSPSVESHKNSPAPQTSSAVRIDPSALAQQPQRRSTPPLDEMLRDYEQMQQPSKSSHSMSLVWRISQLQAKIKQKQSNREVQTTVTDLINTVVEQTEKEDVKATLANLVNTVVTQTEEEEAVEATVTDLVNTVVEQTQAEQTEEEAVEATVTDLVNTVVEQTQAEQTEEEAVEATVTDLVNTVVTQTEKEDVKATLANLVNTVVDQTEKEDVKASVNDLVNSVVTQTDQENHQAHIQKHKENQRLRHTALPLKPCERQAEPLSWKWHHEDYIPTLEEFADIAPNLCLFPKHKQETQTTVQTSVNAQNASLQHAQAPLKQPKQKAKPIPAEWSQPHYTPPLEELAAVAPNLFLFLNDK